MIASMMDQIIIYKSSPHKKDSPKTMDTTTVVPANKKAPTLEVRHYTKKVSCGLSNMISYHQNDMNPSSR